MHEALTGPMTRRRFLAISAALSLIAAASVTACSRTPSGGPAEITWDRDTCEYCRMVISDRAYAAQLRGPKDKVHKFDDLGCLVNWLDARAWSVENVEAWVADHRYNDRAHWLNVRTAHYLPGQTTPMDYGFGATSEALAGSVDFAKAQAMMLNRAQSRQTFGTDK